MFLLNCCVRSVSCGNLAILGCGIEEPPNEMPCVITHRLCARASTSDDRETPSARLDVVLGDGRARYDAGAGNPPRTVCLGPPWWSQPRGEGYRHRGRACWKAWPMPLATLASNDLRGVALVSTLTGPACRPCRLRLRRSLSPGHRWRCCHATQESDPVRWRRVRTHIAVACTDHEAFP